MGRRNLGVLVIYPVFSGGSSASVMQNEKWVRGQKFQLG
ncbi:hypothetical protein EMIT0196P_20270 [Pseudomonas chlororaphis]